METKVINMRLFFFFNICIQCYKWSSECYYSRIPEILICYVFLFIQFRILSNFFFHYFFEPEIIKDFIYLRERETAWDWQGRGADSPLSGEPNWGLIPGPWDPDLSWRQMLNQLSHPGTLTQGLFRCVLISLQIFKYFPELFLFLISNLISLWLQNTLLWLSPFDLLLLLQFILWPKI